MFLGGRTRGEGAKVSPLPRLRILFPRVQPVTTVRKFAHHSAILQPGEKRLQGFLVVGIRVQQPPKFRPVQEVKKGHEPGELG
jgi:hypothetical protein